MSTSGTIAGPGTVARPGTASTPRLRIFQALTLGGAALFLVSWFMPWWEAWIVYLRQTAIYVRPWGAESFLPPEYESSIAGYQMPEFFGPLMWLYLALCMGALAYSMFAPGSKVIRVGPIHVSLPTALVLSVGISYIVCVIVAYFVMQMKVGEYFGATLNGTIYIGLDEGHKSNVDTRLLTGYFVACATGPVIVLLSLLRQFIVGKNKA